MKKYLLLPITFFLLIFTLGKKPAPPKYEKIEIKEIFSKLIIRKDDDRVYSGQIKSEAGLIEFNKAFRVDVDCSKVDFEKEMLIFGITDEITTRVFQFLKQEKTRLFILDYYETGMEFKLRRAPEGKKHSHIQVFVTKKLDGIPHIRVKNLLDNGLSKVYGKK